MHFLRPSGATAAARARDRACKRGADRTSAFAAGNGLGARFGDLSLGAGIL